MDGPLPFILNKLAIFIFVVGFSISIVIPGKNACMYFPKNRGLISVILASLSSIFSSLLNIFGERAIINPDSIDPFKGYYIYDVAKNIKKYYIFQICCVTVFTILCASFIVAFKMKRIGPSNRKGGKKEKILFQMRKIK